MPEGLLRLEERDEATSMHEGEHEAHEPCPENPLEISAADSAVYIDSGRAMLEFLKAMPRPYAVHALIHFLAFEHAGIEYLLREERGEMLDHGADRQSRGYR